MGAISDWGEDVEGVEEEGEDDVEEIPEDEGSDEPVVAGLHLEGALVEQQNSQGEGVACGWVWYYKEYIGLVEQQNSQGEGVACRYVW